MEFSAFHPERSGPVLHADGAGASSPGATPIDRTELQFLLHLGYFSTAQRFFRLELPAGPGCPRLFAPALLLAHAPCPLRASPGCVNRSSRKDIGALRSQTATKLARSWDLSRRLRAMGLRRALSPESLRLNDSACRTLREQRPSVLRPFRQKPFADTCHRQTGLHLPLVVQVQPEFECSAQTEPAPFGIDPPDEHRGLQGKVLGFPASAPETQQALRVLSEQHADAGAGRDTELVAGRDVATHMKSETAIIVITGKGLREIERGRFGLVQARGGLAGGGPDAQWLLADLEAGALDLEQELFLPVGP